MLNVRVCLAAVALGSALSACSVPHGPGAVTYSRDEPVNVGGTSGAAEGTVSRHVEPTKERRGNTPPGLDRDGHGPAAGAIVDPTGAARQGKPY